MPDRTTEDRVVRRIARRKGDVFFRSDFSDLGSPGQVGRALRALVKIVLTQRRAMLPPISRPSISSGTLATACSTKPREAGADKKQRGRLWRRDKRP
jgi:hypothetical protein